MSQFDSLFKRDAKPKTETKPKQKSPMKKSGASPSPTTAADKPALPEKTEKRASGKSSNADYTQVLTYIKKDTHNAVKVALIYDHEKRDLSDLVEELLSDWIKKNSKNS
ncbi:MAG: hypothetical protein M3R14_08315 [Acidobacteriota bacterium]|nr:hypothetical protein [Acidobacteriota bacterium]